MTLPNLFTLGAAILDGYFLVMSRFADVLSHQEQGKRLVWFLLGLCGITFLLGGLLM